MRPPRRRARGRCCSSRRSTPDDPRGRSRSPRTRCLSPRGRSARVRIALAEKDIEYEAIEIDLSDRPAWIYEKNSTGRVPVVEEDAWVLPESAVIMEYLEERYPEPALLAADPADRALARLWIFRHDDFTKPYYALRRGENGAATSFETQLARLDAAVSERGWLGGADYGLAD